MILTKKIPSNKLSLKIIVDDLSNPLIEFVFFEDKRGIDTESEEI